ncbi:hypothetical protein DMB37_30920 [Nocardia sp. CS682]|nr:hypothetical protein DMB37_30920 [Nocardia sp. CS682]
MYFVCRTAVLLPRTYPCDVRDNWFDTLALIVGIIGVLYSLSRPLILWVASHVNLQVDMIHSHTLLDPEIPGDAEKILNNAIRDADRRREK